MKQNVRVHKKWSPEEEFKLAELYETLTAKECAEILDRTPYSVVHKAKLLGLSKSPEWISNRRKLEMQSNENAKRNWFKVGHTPATKGRRQEDFFSKEGLERSKKTRFKKGRVCKHYSPIGTESERTNYIMVKVADPDIWEYKHRLVWEENFGEIPDGHVVFFKNGNSKDCRIENLYLQSREERMSDIRFMYPEEFRQVCLKLNKIDKIVKSEQERC